MRVLICLSPYALSSDLIIAYFCGVTLAGFVVNRQQATVPASQGNDVRSKNILIQMSIRTPEI